MPLKRVRLAIKDEKVFIVTHAMKNYLKVITPRKIADSIYNPQETEILLEEKFSKKYKYMSLYEQEKYLDHLEISHNDIYLLMLEDINNEQDYLMMIRKTKWKRSNIPQENNV
jgi:hypothetical protein